MFCSCMCINYVNEAIIVCGKVNEDTNWTNTEWISGSLSSCFSFHWDNILGRIVLSLEAFSGSVVYYFVTHMMFFHDVLYVCCWMVNSFRCIQQNERTLLTSSPGFQLLLITRNHLYIVCSYYKFLCIN
jgi:hypothetical protein